MSKKYKVWLHLEEIILDEEGKEAEYISADELFLPLPVALTNTLNRAVSVMEEIHNSYWNPEYWTHQID